MTSPAVESELEPLRVRLIGPPRIIVLDLQSSESPTHGNREGPA